MPTGMDFTADRGGVELARLTKLYTFPDYVKQADLATTQNPENIAVTVFADPVRRQFPCHTKAATWINSVYFLEKKAEFHPKDQAQIQARFDHYIAFWGIKAAVDQAQARWAALHKTADARRPDADYALVWAGDNGVKERRLPLTTRMEVKAAAEYLITYRDRIPFADRHTIAGKILEKAAAFGVHLGDHREGVEKQAGQGVCDPAEVVTLLEGRAHLARDPALRDQIRKIAAEVRRVPQRALQPDQLVKLAATVDMVDRTLGLVGKYTAVLPRPEDVLFSATFSKVAQAVDDHVALTSGKVYEKSALAKLAQDDLRDLLGAEFVERVVGPLGTIDTAKMAAEAAALPRPEAQLFEDLLADQGIAPVLQKAASSRAGLSDAQFAALADAYLPA